MNEEKNINSEAYKRGWVDGYSESTDNSANVSAEDLKQYYYGFEDGCEAYKKELNQNS